MEVQNPLSSNQIYPYLRRFLIESWAIGKTGLNSQQILGEVFCLCHRVATDQTPGDNLASRYVDELKQRFCSNRQAELILCLSWVVLMVQEKPTFAIKTFIQQIQPLIRHSYIYNKARQLAVTIRQHERHVNTDFLINTNPIPFMKVQIEGNPGEGNTYSETTYNIKNVETLAPNATTIVNKHYHISGPITPAEEASLEAIVASDEAEDQQPMATRPNPRPIIDTEPIRQEILTWVSKVRPFLCDAWKADYMNIWGDILNMQEVNEKIYNPGRQQNTNFNQYLVVNILYYMFEECGALSENEDYNASALCSSLIGTTEHQLRKELSKNPPEEIKNRLYKYFTKKFEL